MSFFKYSSCVHCAPIKIFCWQNVCEEEKQLISCQRRCQVSDRLYHDHHLPLPSPSHHHLQHCIGDDEKDAQANGEWDDWLCCNSLVSGSWDHAQLDALQPHSWPLVCACVCVCVCICVCVFVYIHISTWRSVGCIMAEMLTGKTLFPGSDRKSLKNIQFWWRWIFVEDWPCFPKKSPIYNVLARYRSADQNHAACG